MPNSTPLLLPRLIRLRDAPFYLGMDKNRFNAEVRPNLTEIPIGIQGIAFDRLELDAWVEHTIACNGRPAWKGEDSWDANKYQVSLKEVRSGISTKSSGDGEFARALAEHLSRKPNRNSQD